jgi:nucleoside-triphosphatase THEP1
MNHAAERKEVWLKASVIGTTWAASEIILGSFLHNLHIPFKGNILTAIGVILLISASYKWKDRGLFWRSGVVCAMMKTMSPSAVIFGPMVAILMESLLFQFSVRVFGRNITGYIFGSILAMSWVFFQKIANLLIYYGNNIVDIYKGLLYFIQKELNITTPLFWELLIALLSLYVILGTITALFGIRTARTLNTRDNNSNKAYYKIGDNLSPTTHISQSFKYSIVWLTFSLITMIVLLYFNSNYNILVWLPTTIVVIIIWVSRYKRAMRQILRPRFWISFMIITLLATITISYLNGGKSDLISGLITGVKMNFRAAVIFIGFSVLGTELYNPTIREKIRNSWLKNAGQAFEIAFESLPELIKILPDASSFIRKPGEVIRLLFTIADSRITSILRNNNEHVAEVFIISGTIEEGKTTLLNKIADELRLNNISIDGFTSPRVFDGKETIGYNIKPLTTGREIKFLRMGEIQTLDKQIGRFRIQPEGLEEGIGILRNCTTAEVVIVDEVGRLEIEGRGWDIGIKKILYENSVVIMSVREEFIADMTTYYNIRNYNVVKLPVSDEAFRNIIKRINLITVSSH